MARAVKWQRLWSPWVITANCVDCGWQWQNAVTRGRSFKTTDGIRLANAAEKHVECLGHRVITNRTRFIVPGVHIGGPDAT